jgi:hypothetical protein
LGIQKVDEIIISLDFGKVIKDYSPVRTSSELIKTRLPIRVHSSLPCGSSDFRKTKNHRIVEPQECENSKNHNVIDHT